MSGLMSLVPWCLTARESSSKSRRDLALARDYLSSPGPLRTQEHSERRLVLQKILAAFSVVFLDQKGSPSKHRSLLYTFSVAFTKYLKETGDELGS